MTTEHPGLADVGELVGRLTRGMREDVARVIDPIAAEMQGRETASVAFNRATEDQWARALTKADAILDALTATFVPVLTEAAYRLTALQAALLGAEGERDEARPWLMFYRDGKSLGEIVEALGGVVYDYTWLMQPLIRMGAEDLQKADARVADAEAALTASEAENARLRAGLEPFAKVGALLNMDAEAVELWPDDDYWPIREGGVQVKHFRTARSLLDGGKGEDNNTKGESNV